MANVREIEIHGLMPFDAGACYLHEDRPEMARKREAAGILRNALASMNHAVFGLRINYSPGPVQKAANEWGGRTEMYAFSVTGIEAVNQSWVEAFENAILLVGGSITSTVSNDLEA